MSNIIYHGKRLTLFNIAKYMLGYEKITEDVHKEWCDNLERSNQDSQTYHALETAWNV